MADFTDDSQTLAELVRERDHEQMLRLRDAAALDLIRRHDPVLADALADLSRADGIAALAGLVDPEVEEVLRHKLGALWEWRLARADLRLRAPEE